MVIKNFQKSMENLSEYHDLYIQSDTLVFGDAFKIFRNKSIEIYDLDPVCLLSAPGLAWQACLKKIEIKLDLLADIDMLLMIEKGIGRDVKHPKKLQNLHIDPPFLPERMKIKKCNKLVCNLYDKNDYISDIRTVKQALNHGLILRKGIK